MNAHIKVILRADFIKKDGTTPLYLRLTLNRKVKYFALNLSVLPIHWDSTKEQVKKSFWLANKFNLLIANSVNRANEIIFDAQVQNKELGLSEFAGRFQSNLKKDSFFDFVLDQIEREKATFSDQTIRVYETQLSKLKKFTNDISINAVNQDFIKSYQNYMAGQLNNNENTCNKSLSFIRNILNRAIKAGLIKENPFKYIPLSRKNGNREFLTMEELNGLEELYNSNKLLTGQKNVLQYFLFACYTGLRYADIKGLRHKHISDSMVKVIMHKTKELVTVPLILKAKALLPEIDNDLFERPVFRVNANQVTNRHLKEIMPLAEIRKPVSFHCARHTFATVGITVGIPIEVISKLLGHKDLKTTQIYAKIMDTVKVEQMKKWEY